MNTRIQIDLKKCGSRQKWRQWPNPPAASFFVLDLDDIKMTMIEVEKLTEDEAKKRLNELIDLDNFNDACEVCGLTC